jgi:hypothetical protein
MGCSTALDLVQPVGQTISRLKSAEGRAECGKILAQRHILGDRRRQPPRAEPAHHLKKTLDMY